MRRRDFLSGLAITPGLAVSRRPQDTVASSAPHGLKLGAVTYNIARDWDVPTIIRNLSEARFDAVELRTTHKHGVETALSKTERAAVRAQFEASPVKIGGLGTTCEFHSPDPAVVRKNIEDTKVLGAAGLGRGIAEREGTPNGIPPVGARGTRRWNRLASRWPSARAFAREHGIVDPARSAR